MAWALLVSAIVWFGPHEVLALQSPAVERRASNSAGSRKEGSSQTAGAVEGHTRKALGESESVHAAASQKQRAGGELQARGARRGGAAGREGAEAEADEEEEASAEAAGQLDSEEEVDTDEGATGGAAEEGEPVVEEGGAAGEEELGDDRREEGTASEDGAELDDGAAEDDAAADAEHAGPVVQERRGSLGEANLNARTGGGALAQQEDAIEAARPIRRSAKIGNEAPPVKAARPSRRSAKAKGEQLLRSKKGAARENEVPQGVQHNFSVSRLGPGWTVHYEKPYADITRLTDVQPPNGTCLLWGAKRRPGDKELVVAAIGHRESIQQHSRVWDNGVFWYTEDHQANGFACDSDIQLAHADNLNSCCESRLSWHLDSSYGGYRAGCAKGLFEDAEWQKVVMFGPCNLEGDQAFAVKSGRAKPARPEPATKDPATKAPRSSRKARRRSTDEAAPKRQSRKRAPKEDRKHQQSAQKSEPAGAANPVEGFPLPNPVGGQERQFQSDTYVEGTDRKQAAGGKKGHKLPRQEAEDALAPSGEEAAAAEQVDESAAADGGPGEEESADIPAEDENNENAENEDSEAVEWITEQPPTDTEQRNVSLDGSFTRTVGKYKPQFLDECNEVLRPISCVDIHQSGFNLTLEGTEADLYDARAFLEQHGLDLPNFGRLSVRMGRKGGLYGGAAGAKHVLATEEGGRSRRGGKGGPHGRRGPKTHTHTHPHGRNRRFHVMDENFAAGLFVFMFFMKGFVI